MTGNQNAVKWTEESVNQELTDMMEEATAGDVYYVGQLLDRFNHYPDWWADMAKKFKDTPSVLRTIKRVEQKLESNLVQAALTGKVKETTAIFSLKAKHKWKDKQEVDHKHTSEGLVVQVKLD